MICKQDIVAAVVCDRRTVGLHLLPPVSLSQDTDSSKDRGGWYKIWSSSCNAFERERATKRDQQKATHLQLQSEDYFSALSNSRFACNLRHKLADNLVCSEHTLGESVDLVTNFV